ncbi:MAG: NUDIX hydrolase [Ekhidna sp.]|nr:NUDIX hydrolase [Ekhidna sp.]
MLNQTSDQSPFEGKVRVRACGILKKENSILFAKHNGIGTGGHLWSPPGGGVNFGDSIEQTIIKEFKEETNLKVEVGSFLFANEHIDDKHHAIELFFQVNIIEGDIKLGFDPELPPDQQILSDLRFLSKKQLSSFPSNTIHKAFQTSNEKGGNIHPRGFITFQD